MEYKDSQAERRRQKAIRKKQRDPAGKEFKKLHRDKSNIDMNVTPLPRYQQWF